MFSPAAVPKHEIKYSIPKHIPREIGDQARRDLVRSIFAYFNGTHLFHLNFNRHIPDERATRLTDRFFGQLWREHGIKLITLGVIVQHKGGTHLHIFARDKEPSRYDLPEPKKKQVFLRDLSEIEMKRLQKLWQPFGRTVKNGACIEAVRDMESVLVYVTCERNIPPGGNPIFYLGLNRSVPKKIIKKFGVEWEAKLDLVAEEAECDAVFKKRSPAPVIPLPIPDRTEPSEPVSSPLASTDTVPQLSTEEFLREINEAIGLTDTVRQLPDTVTQLSDTVRQLFVEELLREIGEAGTKSERSNPSGCAEYEWYVANYYDVLARLFDDTVKATFPLREKQRYAALKTNTRRRANREEAIRQAIEELSSQGERITRRRVSSLTGVPVSALSRPHYKHLFEPGLPNLATICPATLV